MKWIRMRAWDKNRKIMLTDIALTNKGVYGLTVVDVCGGHGEYYPELQLESYLGQPYEGLTPMLYSNISDISNEDIYELDVVEGNGQIGVVQFINGAFVVETKDSYFPLYNKDTTLKNSRECF